MIVTARFQFDNDRDGEQAAARLMADLDGREFGETSREIFTEQ